MSISDELMWRYIELLSFQPIEAADKWKKEVADGGNPRDIKVLFAREIVARFHSARAAEAAVADFEALQARRPAENIPEVTVKIPNESRKSRTGSPSSRSRKYSRNRSSYPALRGPADDRAGRRAHQRGKGH